MKRTLLAVLAVLLCLAPSVAQASPVTTYYFAIYITDTDPQGPGVATTIIDNQAAGTCSGAISCTGTWANSAAPGSYGVASVFSNSANATYRFNFSPPSTATYEVYARWTTNTTTRSTAVSHTVYNGSSSTVVTLNHKNGGGRWHSLGVYTLASGSYVEFLGSAGNDNQAGPDAVKFVKQYENDGGTITGAKAIRVEQMGPYSSSQNCLTAQGVLTDDHGRSDNSLVASDCWAVTTTAPLIGTSANAPYFQDVITKHPVDHPDPAYAGKLRSARTLGPFPSNSCLTGRANTSFNSTAADFSGCRQVDY